MQVLYRKYRPKKLSEVVGQDHIVTTLQHALKNGHTAHAYLFTGPRGVGKTSIARILAHEINELEYNEDETRLDIIEIDAASNRRIDEIRELRDKVHIAPVSCKYKVYIIDEVHMLTKEAFNALLKTLEEPPKHAVFILATTELNKVPETITSRTQHFAFKPVGPKVLAKHLGEIAKKEKIDIDEEALEMLAAHGNGSFRDSISMLDQVKNFSKKITADDVRSITGAPSINQLKSVVEVLQGGSLEQTRAELQAVIDDGVDPATFALNLSENVREEGIARASSKMLNLAGELLRIPSGSNVRLALELALIKYKIDEMPVNAKNEVPVSKKAEAQPETVEPIAKETVADEEAAPEPTFDESTETAFADSENIESQETASDESEKNIVTGSFDDSTWQKVLVHLKQHHNTLYGILRMAQADFSNIESGGRLTLRFNFPFHQKRASETKNRQAVITSIHEVTGSRLIVQCEVNDKKATKPVADKLVEEPAEEQPQAENPINKVLDIFQGAEVMEGN